MDIRCITPTELPAAEAMTHAAGLPIGLENLALYQALQPDGFFVAVDEGNIVGTAAVVCYDTCAFVGAVAVHPSSQGRGMGTALMHHLLAWTDARDVFPVLLEATPQGEPLYRKLGFVEDYRTVVYARERDAASDLDCQLARELVAPMTPSALDAVAAFDAPGFGAMRRHVLAEAFARWPERAFVAHDHAGRLAGYALASKSRIGPWVATDAAAAEALLDAALTLPFASGPVVALPGLNKVGGTLLLRAGFEPQRNTWHMRRGGTDIIGRPEAIFGRMTLGLG